MLRGDLRDILGGGLLVLFGLALAVYTMAQYDVGTLNNMGPGMFPAGMGWIIAGLGLFVLVPALFRTGKPLDRIEWRPFIAINLAAATFALLIRPFGMIPAVIATTLVAIFADGRLSPLGAALLSVALAGLSWLVFHMGLGTSIPVLRWPL